MNTIVSLAFVAATVLPTAASGLPQQPPPSDPPGALPYDLAFSMASFIWDTQFAVSADGRFVAYAVRVPPSDTTVNLDERYQPNGTPSSVMGATIRYTDMVNGQTVELCPGGSCWRPVWSPDGSSIAFFSDADGLPQLWVYDIAAGASRKLSDEPVKPKLWHGDEPRWSPDGSTLYAGFAPEGPFRNPVRPAEVRPENPAGVVVLRSGSEAAAAPDAESPPPTPMTDHYAREHLVAVKAIDVRSGATRLLVAQDAEFPAGTLRRSASGRWLGYLSTFRPESDTTQSTVMDVAVVPTAGGDAIPVVRSVPLTRYDYFGVSYVWHPSDDRLMYLDGKRMHLLDLRSGPPAAPVPLAHELGDVAPTVFAFTRDGEAAVMGVDVVDDQGYGDPRPRAMAVVPLDGGPPSTFAIDDERWTYDQLLKADERTAWQPDGASISVLVTERSTGDKAILRHDPASGSTRVLWKARARLVNLTSGGSHDFIVGQYEDMRTPSDIFRFDADFSGRERISHIDPRLDRVQVGTAETFETTVPLHDGTLATVKTAVLLPPGAERGDRLPAVVTMYPGSDITRRAAEFAGGSVFTVPNLVFTSRGYAVVLCELTLGPNEQAGNPIRDMVDVLLPQVYRAAELGYVDLNRLAITGQSYGGYGTGSIITRTSIFRAAVPISGIFDLFGSYGHIDVDGGGFFLAWSEGGQARMGSHPWADVRRYLDNSPYYNADKITTPVLIVHGTADMAYHDAGKLFTALRRLGKPAQLASYLDQGHVISSWHRESAIDAARRMVEFYRRHLGDPAAVLHLPGRTAPWAIEVKLGLAPKPSRGLHHARADLKPGRTFIVGAGDDRYAVAEGVEVIGLRELVGELGRYAE